MAGFKYLKRKTSEGILTLSINNPDRLNVLNTATLDELGKAIKEAYDNDDVKGIIITGEGDKAFVAGADVAEIAGLNETNARKFSENGQEIFTLIEESNKPVIAAVNGYALGGGCELAMACHLRVASVNAQFGQPEARMGIIPGYGGTQRLTQLVGKGKAMELLMTGNSITAEEAKNIGLVNYVTTHDDLYQHTRDFMKRILENAPLSLGMIIDCINAMYNPSENGFQTEANLFGNCCKKNDFKEGTQAFLKKRPPMFKGQ